MAVVVSAGQVADVSSAATPYEPYTLRLGDDAVFTYGALYASQPSVRTVISFIARNVADLSIQTFRRVSDTDRERITDHPFATTMAAPFPGVTPYRWKEALLTDLCVFDVYYALKVRGAGGRIGLQRLPPEWVTPDGGTWFAPEAYIVAGGGRSRLRVPAEEMVVIRGYHPTSARVGLPPMEALRQMLVEEFESGRYRRAMWRSGARISGVINRPAEAEWSDTARQRFRSDWRALYSAGGAEAGGTPILEEGMTYTPHAFSAEQAQYIESRKLSREESAAAYHVPPPMVGILDHATFSNITEQHKNLYQDTLGPWLTLISQELQAQVLPEFSGISDLYCEFNLQSKLRGSFEEEAARLQTAVGGPWLTRNEARARQNLPSLDGADELIVPLNVTAGGQASPTDSGSQNLNAAPDPVAKTTPTLERP